MEKRKVRVEYLDCYRDGELVLDTMVLDVTMDDRRVMENYLIGMTEISTFYETETPV